MEIEQALKRIEELENNLIQFHEEGLDDNDKSYVEKLKADMKKAAIARDKSQQRAETLQNELATQNTRHLLETQFRNHGCIDCQTLLKVIENDEFPIAEAKQEEIDAWVESKKNQYAYFFTQKTKLSEENKLTSTSGPMVASRRVKKDLNVQQQAAMAYKHS